MRLRLDRRATLYSGHGIGFDIGLRIHRVAAQGSLVSRFTVSIKLLAYPCVLHRNLLGVHHQRMGGLALKGGYFGNRFFQIVRKFESGGGGVEFGGLCPPHQKKPQANQ